MSASLLANGLYWSCERSRVGNSGGHNAIVVRWILIDDPTHHIHILRTAHAEGLSVVSGIIFSRLF